MRFRMWKDHGARLVLNLLLSALVATPALAQGDILLRGTDAWQTPGDGSTQASLSLPAGFLDANCPPFQQTVVLEGVPIVTSPGGAFGDADTLMERIVDTVYDADWKATTSIVVRALHLRAVEPLQTGCGTWTADIGLNGSQSVTLMRVSKTSEEGGVFSAPISARVTWTFARTSDGLKRTLNTNNVLNAGTPTAWRSEPCPGALLNEASTIVDSDNDGKPDRTVAGTWAGFNPGWDEICRRLKPCRDKNLDPARHCYVPVALSASEAR